MIKGWLARRRYKSTLTCYDEGYRYAAVAILRGIHTQELTDAASEIPRTWERFHFLRGMNDAVFNFECLKNS